MSKVSAAVILAKAKSYVGTKESPANSNNVIFNTHYYGQAVSGGDYPWCAVFLWDIFRMCGASELYYGGKKCAYTPTLANYYKSINQWFTTPKAGDLVFFKFATSNRICHVGIVLEVLSNGTIKTIEGNTSSSNDSNGGCVEIRTRNAYIVGYGRPLYGNTTPNPVAPAVNKSGTYNFTEFVKDVQRAIGAKVDGEVGPETFGKTVTLSKKVNHTHAAVAAVQRYLNLLGYDCGEVDGDFGSKTEAGVKKFQSQWTSKPDGIITAKNTTWKKLLKYY